MYITVAGHRWRTLESYLLLNNITLLAFEHYLTTIIATNFSKNDIFIVSWTDGFDELVTKILIKLNYSFKMILSEQDYISTDKVLREKTLRLEKEYKNHALEFMIMEWTYIKRNKELIKDSKALLYFNWLKDSNTKKIIWYFEEFQDIVKIPLKYEIWIIKVKD